VNGLQGIGLEFLEQTCGSLAYIALVSHENSQDCRWLRMGAQLCECPRAENTCTICRGGDAMSNPIQELVFTFGAINDIYTKDFVRISNRKSTCEVAESVFSSFYTQDDSRCYWNQLLRGQVCGCPDNSELLFGHNVAREFSLYPVPCLSSCQLSRKHET
jgi:hypothetical protein